MKTFDLFKTFEQANEGAGKRISFLAFLQLGKTMGFNSGYWCGAEESCVNPRQSL